MGKLPLRILVVDDEPSIQDSYLSVLESYKKNPYQQFLNKKFFASEISQNEEVEVEEEENVYQVDYVSQGEQAVQAVIDSKQNNNPYCIIFLDVRMPPGIDGVQTAKKVRQIDDLVEIVIMTAYSDYTFHQIALELGTSQRLLYFQKPFIPNQLRQLTMSLSQRWEVESILNGKKEATTNLFFQDDFCSTLESQDRSVTEKLNLWLQEIQHIDASLKEKADQIYEKKLNLLDSIVLKLNSIRKFFRFYLIPWIQNTLEKKETEQVNCFSFIQILNHPQKFLQFLNHFFGICYVGSDWEVIQRDQEVQKKFILFDLYKLKKLLELLEFIKKDIKSHDFIPISFSSTATNQIIESIQDILTITSTQCINPLHYQEFQKLTSKEFFQKYTVPSQAGITISYCHPKAIEGNRYERVFFQILFRNRILTKKANENVSINYDFIQFEKLKAQYIQCKKKKYSVVNPSPSQKLFQQQIEFYEKPFIEWILENPSDCNSNRFLEAIEELENHTQKKKESNVSKTITKIKSVFQSDEKQKFSYYKDQGISKLEGMLSKLDSISKGELKTPIQNLEIEQSRATHNYKNNLNIQDKVGFVLILLSAQELKHCKTKIEKKLQPLNFNRTLVTSNQFIHRDLLYHADLIVLVRNDFPEKDQDGVSIQEHFFQEKTLYIGDSSIENIVSKIPETQKNQMMIENIYQKLFTFEKIPQYYESYQIEKDIISKQQQLQELRSKQKTTLEKIQTHSSEYSALLIALFFESFLEGKHLLSLGKKLLNVSHCLLIDDIGKDVLQFLKENNFDTQIKLWNSNKFLQQKGNDLSIEQFFQHSYFNRYESVIYVDWKNATNSTLPIYLRTKVLKKSLVFHFNLFSVFSENSPFLDRCSFLLETLDLKESLPILEKQVDFLQKKFAQLSFLKKEIQQLEDSILEKEETLEKFSVIQSPHYQKEQENYFLNKIEFLIRYHTHQLAL